MHIRSDREYGADVKWMQSYIQILSEPDDRPVSDEAVARDGIDCVRKELRSTELVAVSAADKGVREVL